MGETPTTPVQGVGAGPESVNTPGIVGAGRLQRAQELTRELHARGPPHHKMASGSDQEQTPEEHAATSRGGLAAAAAGLVYKGSSGYEEQTPDEDLQAHAPRPAPGISAAAESLAALTSHLYEDTTEAPKGEDVMQAMQAAAAESRSAASAQEVLACRLLAPYPPLPAHAPPRAPRSLIRSPSTRFWSSTPSGPAAVSTLAPSLGGPRRARRPRLPRKPKR